MIKNSKQIALIGAGTGWGAQIRDTEQGPDTVHGLGLEDILLENEILASWKTMVHPPMTSKDIDLDSPNEALDLVNEVNRRLANIVQNAVRAEEFPIVIGGDHSIAVATWGTIAVEHDMVNRMGLIWIDAHMDSHVPETSPSHAFHGMPVAALLGCGDPSFVNVVQEGPKILPENIVLLGVRSYEPEEEKFLDDLGVRVFRMEEIRQIGFDKAFEKALKIVKSNTKGFGMSVDLDGFDPVLAPGVGSPVPNGLLPNEVLPCFQNLKNDDKFMGLEITELNPVRDQHNQTAALVKNIILSIFLENNSVPLSTTQ